MSQKFKSEVELQALNNATTDTDKFLVSDSGVVKYRTGAQMLSDLGVAPGVASNIQHQVKAGVAINKGQAVYVTGADGTNMIVGLASNASEATSSKTMGLLASTVSINGFANVIAEGLLAGLNTIGATAGDPVWLGTGGNLIYGLLNKPYAPAHLVFIGIVTRVNANNGEIFVKVQNGFELNEIHDVDLKTTTPINGHILGFDGTLWVNKTIAGWLGYTPWHPGNDGSGSGLDADLLDGYHASAFQLALTNPVTGTGTTNYVSKFTSGTTLGNSQIFDNGTNVGIGTSSPSSLLSVAGNATFGQGANRPVTYDSNGGNFRITPNSGGWATGYLFNGSAGTYKGGFGGFGGGDTLSYLWIGDDYNIPTITVMPNQGNVGIGTTSPTSKLTINGNTHIIGGGTPSSGVGLEMQYSGNTSYIGSYDRNFGVYKDIFFYSANTIFENGGLERMRITSGGNVGIGTTSPSEKLHISGNTLVTGTLEVDTVNNGVGDFLTRTAGGIVTRRTAAEVRSDIGAQAALTNPVTGTGTLNFVSKFTSTGSTLGNSQIFDDGSSVGIGTSGPLNKVDIVSSNNDSFGAITVRPSNQTQTLSLGWQGVSASLNFIVNTAAAERMRVTDTGNVGIGTSIPGYRLDVSGSTRSAEFVFPQTDFNPSAAARTTTSPMSIKMWNNYFSGIGLGSDYGTVLEYYSLVSHVDSQVYFDAGGGSWYRTASYNSNFGSWQKYLTSSDISGTTNYVSKFTGANSLGNSLIYDNGTNVGIGTTSPAGKLNAIGDIIAGSFTYTTGVNLQNRTAKSLLYISTDGVNNAIGSTITYTWADGGQGPLKFNNTSGEVMRLDASGKLGVGTTNPTSRIHSVTSAAGPVTYDNRCAIFGDNTAVSTVYPNSVGVAGRVLTSDGRAIYGDATTGGGWGGYFDGKGYFSANVGIGTTGPNGIWSGTNRSLQINGATNTSSELVQTRTGASITRFLSGTSDVFGVYTANALNYEVYTSGVARMRITSGGNVGIGTTSPATGHKLEVNGRIATVTGFGDFTALQSAGGTGFRWTLSNNGTFSLQKTANGFSTLSATPIMVDSSNNVGIGTTAPVRALQVGGFSGNPEICIGSGTTGFGSLVFGDSASGNDPWRGFVQYNHATDAMIIGTANASWLTLTNGGALGLNVNPTNTAGRFEASNDIVAYSSSDKRWKTNIKNIDSPLEKISQINGVEFDWIEDEPVHGNKGHDIGVIAQEIEKILPDAVQTRESGMKAVKYEKVIPLLIEAIKEQQKQIEELKQIVNGFTK
jgi:hypothetical protein